MEIVANDTTVVAGLVSAAPFGYYVCARAGGAGRFARAPAAAMDLPGLLLLASGAAAQSPDSEPSGAKPFADQEPITPIPPPPAADPLKLALGERLFGDLRLSGDGKLACSSCHDLQTNGAGGGQTDGP